MSNISRSYSSVIKAFFLIVVVFYLQSCSMTAKVVAQTDCDTYANNDANKVTHWTYFWGLMERDNDIKPNCQSKTLSYVYTKTNIGFILISFFTLGAVVPQQIEWCCAPLHIPTENPPVDPPK